MIKTSYKVVSVDGVRFVTICQNGAVHLVSDDTHTNIPDIIEAADAGDDVTPLVDVGRAIEQKFEDVAIGRVAVRGGVVYFDDDPMDGAVADAIVRFLQDGDDVTPLVKFMENVMANPQEHSREQFYRWLDHHDFPIDDDGCIVAYKGVTADHKSVHSGGAFVQREGENASEWVSGQIPNEKGSTITMPRSSVAHDPNVACHTGLHAGTWEYASSFAPVVLHVKINPRDVVSVPNDCTSQKVRVCRYEVLALSDGKYAGNHYVTDDADFDEDDVDEDYWDEYQPTA